MILADNEVGGPVVAGISIHMMNVGAGTQILTKRPFDHHEMLRYIAFTIGSWMCGYQEFDVAERVTVRPTLPRMVLRTRHVEQP